jgi:hypothetical protein
LQGTCLLPFLNSSGCSLLLLLLPGVPMMSVRDAMYDVMFDADNAYGVKRKEILVDIVHVGD